MFHIACKVTTKNANTQVKSKILKKEHVNYSLSKKIEVPQNLPHLHVFQQLCGDKALEFDVLLFAQFRMVELFFE
jgi:hypothetical protein